MMSKIFALVLVLAVSCCSADETPVTITEPVRAEPSFNCTFTNENDRFSNWCNWCSCSKNGTAYCTYKDCTLESEDVINNNEPRCKGTALYNFGCSWCECIGDVSYCANSHCYSCRPAVKMHVPCSNPSWSRQMYVYSEEGVCSLTEVDICYDLTAVFTSKDMCESTCIRRPGSDKFTEVN